MKKHNLSSLLLLIIVVTFAFWNLTYASPGGPKDCTAPTGGPTLNAQCPTNCVLDKKMVKGN